MPSNSNRQRDILECDLICINWSFCWRCRPIDSLRGTNWMFVYRPKHSKYSCLPSCCLFKRSTHFWPFTFHPTNLHWSMSESQLHIFSFLLTGPLIVSPTPALSYFSLSVFLCSSFSFNASSLERQKSSSPEVTIVVIFSNLWGRKLTWITIKTKFVRHREQSVQYKGWPQ